MAAWEHPELQDKFWSLVFVTVPGAFNVCLDHKRLWNPAVLGRTPRPGLNHFRNHDHSPFFPRGARLHVPHTYKGWNAHHISGLWSYSAACAFQLWSSIVFPTSLWASSHKTHSHNSTCFHAFCTSSVYVTSCSATLVLFNGCCMQNNRQLENNHGSKRLNNNVSKKNFMEDNFQASVTPCRLIVTLLMESFKRTNEITALHSLQLVF